MTDEKFNFDFEVDVNPKHLSSIKYEGCSESIEMLSKLPVKSVDFMGILVVGQNTQFTDKFYGPLSHSLDQLKVVEEARLEVDCGLVNFDPRRASFANLTYLLLQVPTL